MKKCLTLALATLALAGLAATVTPAVDVAQADTAGCVSKREFKNVKRGFTKKRVHRIFDTKGKQFSWFNVGGDTYESREYRACTVSFGIHGTVYMDYTNNRVDSKMAIW